MSGEGTLTLKNGKWVRVHPPPDTRTAEEKVAASQAKLLANLDALGVKEAVKRVEARAKAEEAARAAEIAKKIKALEEPASCAVMGGKRTTRRSSRKNRKQTRRSPRKNRKQARRS